MSFPILRWEARVGRDVFQSMGREETPNLEPQYVLREMRIESFIALVQTRLRTRERADIPWRKAWQSN